MAIQMNEKENQINKNKKRLTGLAIVALIALLFAIGLSRAWFVNDINIATLVNVEPPSPISIRGPHGQALTQLSLDYTDNDKQGNKVTIKRVISVSSDTDTHKLEIIHTTNLKKLEFKLYAATEVTNNGDIEEGGYSYTYNEDQPIAGSYINKEKETSDYKYANSKLHTYNFGESYSNVQFHAEPIYWLASDTLKGTLNKDKSIVSDEYLTYYVLEISWEETTKETDIFYILAESVS